MPIRSSPRRQPPPDNCPLEACLDILGKRWSAQILWYLRAGPRRFGDLKRDLGAISTKILTERLKELQDSGVITRSVEATRPVTVLYALSKEGAALSPVLDAMETASKRLKRVIN